MRQARLVAHDRRRGARHQVDGRSEVIRNVGVGYEGRTHDEATTERSTRRIALVGANGYAAEEGPVERHRAPGELQCPRRTPLGVAGFIPSDQRALHLFDDAPAIVAALGRKD